MNETTKWLGLALIILGVVFPIWRLTRRDDKTSVRPGTTLGVGFLAVFAGISLVLADRITEFSLRGVGTIRTVTDQAVSDAKTVADLKSRVENQSATVDLVATQAANSKKISEEAEQKLVALNTALEQAESTLAKLREEDDFKTIVLEAQSDDRASFDKLQNIAGATDNRFSKLASQAWLTIFEAHSNPFSQSGFKIPWAPGVDPAKLSFEQLVEQYRLTPAQLKPAILEYIWNRNDIQKIKRLDFLMEVMKSDASLTAVEYASRYFTQGTSQQIKPMALDYLSSWWNEHRSEFENQ